MGMHISMCAVAMLYGISLRNNTLGDFSFFFLCVVKESKKMHWQRIGYIGLGGSLGPMEGLTI